MGRKKTHKPAGSKKIGNDQKKEMQDVSMSCPYEEKKCFECDIRDCPEEF